MKICIIGRTKPLLETAKFLNEKKSQDWNDYNI